MKEFVKELLQRLRSESPDFFKQLQKIAVFVMLAAAALYGLLWLDMLPVTPEQHKKLETACYAVGTFFLSTFFTAMVPAKEPPEDNNQ